MAEVREWTVWPWAQDRFVKRFFSVALVLLATITIYLYSQSVLLSAVTVLVLLLALADYFFPLKYRLSEEGLTRISLFGQRLVRSGAELHTDGERIFYGRMRVFIPRGRREEILEALRRVGRSAGVGREGSGEDDRQGGEMGGSSGV
ncbi:MAG: hypothetical protein DRP82_04180 [Planctomycetota bacterium]|nr:MAG: hypothetical protein DRP82_04180 [Planctomycetota bacterium]